VAFKDNRDFIAALKQTGDVVSISQEIDWDLEAGAISRRAMELYGPAVLFENIKDYPGHRMFAGILATYRRVAIALGLPPDTPIRDIYRVYEQRDEHPIPPVTVPTGPCKENILTGDKIDLYDFPAPMIHDGDGGRYIGTWCFSVSKNPETGWVNWGTYRFMVLNKNTISGMPSPGSHLAMIMKDYYLPRNQPMPWALVIGPDPLSATAGLAGYRIGENEADHAGALRQEPVEVVKCETNDLMVPAHAEIIIEGEILPDTVAPEGPFGEYPGYRVSEFKPKVFCRVTAITHRNSPIMTVENPGIPPDGSSVGGSMGVAIALKRRLQKHGFPVVDVYCPPEGAAHLVVVSVKKGGHERAKAIHQALLTRRAWYTKIIVVDDDIDVYNLGEVIHAWSVKCHSYQGIYLAEAHGKGGPATPAHSNEERARQYGAVACFDATWPVEWPDEYIPVRSSFADVYPEDLKARVLKHWKEYGF